MLMKYNEYDVFSTYYTYIKILQKNVLSTNYNFYKYNYIKMIIVLRI